MRIDRNNYETFFLLYADNELDAATRTEVELFVSQNADLAAELKALQQATLAADTIIFNRKESLYKKENGISLANYEEYFLLSADNELDLQQQDQVEKFVLTHPNLQQEMTLLRQTILLPPHLPFEDKKALYRKERRAIPIMWLRMSAAALFGCIVAGAWMFNYNSNRAINNNPTAVAHTPDNVTTPQKPQVVSLPSPTEKAIAVAQPKVQNTDNRKDETTIVKTRRTSPAVIKTEQFKQPGQLVKNDPLPDLQKDDANNTDNAKLQHSQPVAIVDDIPEKKTTTAETAANFVVNKDQDTNPVTVTNAVYHYVDNTEEDKSFYIGSADINKNKLKGLFKKAASLFDKKSGKNENKTPLQIAGFQIGG